MKSDIEIARQCKMLPISDIAARLGLNEEEYDVYAKYKSKINDEGINRLKSKENGKLVLVTAINPTPAGEGKTTTTVGLGQAMARLNKNAIVALREPSLGPVFGMKGGAAGGGMAQVVPMEDINLHFTGDIHAITMANNLLCAMIDNHIHQGNALGIDPNTIQWRRCIDMNDRVLRSVVVGLGPKINGLVREDKFQITVASEIMAILCLCEDINDMKKRIGKILIAFTFDGAPVYARQLKVQGAMCALLKDAIKPNLVQTLENTPCLIHGGPFANIAHGCNSVRATKLGLKLADYCITEAGFGADLGAEKFFNIKCRLSGLVPSVAVLVATVRALKYNGGVAKDCLSSENIPALVKGSENLIAHIESLGKFGVPVVVALNKFDSDTKNEIETVKKICTGLDARFAISEVFEKGGAGGEQLAREVCRAAESASLNFKPLYPLEMKIEDKIHTIVTEIYGGDGAEYSQRAKKMLAEIYKLGLGNLPVCMAKTQYSLSDNPSLVGRPSGFKLSVSDLQISAGAGFIVVLTGEVMTMPGLPRNPGAQMIDIDNDGNITGLF